METLKLTKSQLLEILRTWEDCKKLGITRERYVDILFSIGLSEEVAVERTSRK